MGRVHKGHLRNKGKSGGLRSYWKDCHPERVSVGLPSLERAHLGLEGLLEAVEVAGRLGDGEEVAIPWGFLCLLS